MFTYSADKFVYLRDLSSRVLLLGLSLFLLSGNLLAGGVNLAWSPPTTGSTPTGYKAFYGTSSGNYGSSVDAGNATASTIPNLTAGTTYYFALKSYDAAGNQSAYSKEVSATVPTTGSLTVDFTANPNTPQQGKSVTFTPTVTPSTATISSWSWSFGSGASTPSSTGQIPSLSYASAGTYPVTLTVKDSTGQSATKTNTITVLTAAQPPVAGFTSSATALTASFTNTSTGSISSWSWNFGEPSSPTNTSAAQNPSHTYSAAGTYPVTLTVTGSNGTNSTTSSIKVSAPTGGGTGVNGLVAAYGFEEASGATVVDASGKGNHGTMQYTNRITNGRFGKALSFDGVQSLVTVKDSDSLDLTTGMTFEAWVYDTSNTTGWGTILWKDTDTADNGVYYLYGNSDSNSPVEGILVGSDQLLYGTSRIPSNAWVHLAATYDGQYQRLYVNGQQVSAQVQQGAIPKSTGVLRIGSDLWQGFFKGYIDEVRIYNRALTPQEVIGDLNKSVNTTNPPKPVYGNQNLGSTVDTLLNGTAVASKSVAQASSMMTGLNIYLDAGTTSTKLVFGVYSDKNGHPNTLLTSGTLVSPQPGKWNSLTVPPILQVKGTTYWIALMSPNGTIKLRDYVGTAGLAIERSASHALTTLPPTWIIGTLSSDGPVSGYGLGY